MREELIERNRAAMRRFENCINTNDLSIVMEKNSESDRFLASIPPARQHSRRRSVLPLKALSDQS